MIEINIPVETAVNLLRDQVRLEFKRQQRAKLVAPNISLYTLDEKKMKEIIETSLFDILVLLPVTIVTEESNLKEIIFKAVRTLSKEYNSDFLNNYSENKAESLLLKIRKIFGNSSATTTFQNN